MPENRNNNLWLIVVLVAVSSVLIYDKFFNSGGGVVQLPPSNPVTYPQPQPQYQPVPQTQPEYQAPPPVNDAATRVALTVQAASAGMTQRANPTPVPANTAIPPTPLPTLKVYDTVTICLNGVVMFREDNFSEPIGLLNKGETWDIVGRNNDASWVALGVDGVYAGWVPSQRLYCP